MLIFQNKFQNCFFFKIYQLLGSLTTSLDWKLSTKGLDNQTSFHILELMWWLNVKEWEELYETVLLGTSYSQETIQYVTILKVFIISAF